MDFTTRNYGYISKPQQVVLANSVISIAGLGGVGGAVAVQLARMGIGSIRLADPDTFDTTNLNRQEGATRKSIGRNKAQVIGELCREINPDIQLVVYPEGISLENVEEFVTGVSLVVEGTDYTVPHIGVSLARAARNAKCPLIMGVEIGFGTIVTGFSPSGYTYERYLGLADEVSIEHLQSGKATVPLMNMLPALPRYGDPGVLKAVATGTMSAPAIAPAVALTSGTITSQVVAHLIGTDRPIVAPYVLWFDGLQAKARIIRYRRMRQTIHYINILWRNRRNKNTKML